MCVVLAFSVWSVAGCSSEDGDGDGATGGTAGTGGAAGTGGSAGNGGGGTGGGSVELTLEQQVVGGWTQSGSCGDITITVGTFICPGGRVRGAESFDGSDFLQCGTWSAEEPDSVSAELNLIAVIDPSDPGNDDVLDFEYTYDAENDQLIQLTGPCQIPLVRVEGGVTADDCESDVCSGWLGGSSAPVQCTVDCDCGRCNYCESGTCRYGGEGPFGCYRGCGEYVP
jgi:hypothetical protein